MGALTYHPPAGPGGDPGGPFELEALARQSRDLLEGRTSVVLPQLLRAGGSPGGARPKVLVGFDPARDVISDLSRRFLFSKILGDFSEHRS